jgi:hypothetical protein
MAGVLAGIESLLCVVWRAADQERRSSLTVLFKGGG